MDNANETTDAKPAGFSYLITPRAAHAGGGWRLQLLEDGLEVGGGVYPVNEDTTSDDAHLEAMDDAEAWLASCGASGTPAAIAEIVSRDLEPAAATVLTDERIESLPRYRDLGGFGVTQWENGEYVKFADVERLLAHAGVTAELVGDSSIPFDLGKLAREVTQAPWTLDAPDGAHVVSEDYHVIRAGCGFLAEAKDQREPGFRIAGHMTEADARLITAAPVLLEALRQIRATQPTDEKSVAVLKAEVAFYKKLWQQSRVVKSGVPADAGLTEDADTQKDEAQQQLLHPATQVYFRAGLLACREYMARFVEAESPGIAASIRANWWPSLGKDFGSPRKLNWEELTEGEYDTPSFRVKTAEEVSPTQEALPIALGFFASIGAAPTIPAQAPAADEVRAVALEEAVKACEAERVEIAGPSDAAYNLATDHCIKAIRALAHQSTANNAEPADQKNEGEQA